MEQDFRAQKNQLAINYERMLRSQSVEKSIVDDELASMKSDIKQRNAVLLSGIQSVNETCGANYGQLVKKIDLESSRIDETAGKLESRFHTINEAVDEYKDYRQSTTNLGDNIRGERRLFTLALIST